MKIAVFEKSSQHDLYGSSIQIQSNALRVLQRINPKVCKETLKVGTITVERISGLKIGYKKIVFLGLGQKYQKRYWLVSFNTLKPVLEAGLPATEVVDSLVIQ